MGEAPRRAPCQQDAEAHVLRTPRSGGVPQQRTPNGPGLESSYAAGSVNILARAGMPGTRWGTHGRDLLVSPSTLGSHGCPCRHTGQHGGDGGRVLRISQARGLAPERCAGVERPVVLLTDDTPAVHTVWWASRSGAGGVEVRADPQQGTCGAGTTCQRESCGRMTRAKARQAVRVLSMLPQACRTGTTGQCASTAVPCVAALRHGGGRGWGSSAHHGCSETLQG
jgi:hypothetical protein